MVELKNSKYSMKFSLAHNIDKEELYQRVLQCLSAREEYTPQKIAIDSIRFSDYKEEIYDDYATKNLIRLIYLRRDRKLKYELKINLYDMNSQYLYLEWKDQMNQKKWDAFAALSETLIAAFQPDIAWLGRYYHVEQPFANRTEELLYMMGYSFRIGSNYDEYGPGGLGLITYLGEDFASRLGPERIAQSPIESNRTSWGATALTLVQNPYEASEEVIADAWETAMDYFSDANFFAISMPSKISGEDGLEEFCGERTGGDEVFQFWNRREFCYEALDYLDRGEYEKAVEEITRELEECESDDQNNWLRKIGLVNRVKALEKLERWEEAIRDLSELIEYFEPAFDMVTGWCKNCNDSCALDYSKEEYELLDKCMKAGYWPYEVTNQGYVYVKRKWHLEPGNIKNTDFEDLPDNWCCPYCGAPKQDFITQRVQKKEAFKQAGIYLKRGEMYRKTGKQELAKADFDRAKSLDATLLT